jgi:hypothetical protein
LSVDCFPFCGICTLEELPNASGQRKYLKNWKLFENLVFWLFFFGPKSAFFHGILKKLANFNIQLCSKHISPHLFVLHLLPR